MVRGAPQRPLDPVPVARAGRRGALGGIAANGLLQMALVLFVTFFLYRDGAAIMPRDFRQQHGPCVTAATPMVPPNARPAAAPPPPLAPLAAAPRSGAAQRCDGRTRCAQMTSCEEATWFLRHCPGVQMDGDGDGVPCERQWCRP